MRIGPKKHAGHSARQSASKKIKHSAKEALDKSAFLFATRTTTTDVRIQGNQAIKIQTGTDISLMPAEDFRMNIFHSLIVEKVGLNMFSKVVAEVKAITLTLEVGQKTWTTSVLVMERFKSRPVMDWEADAEHLKNWDPLTSTVDKIEKTPGAEDRVKSARSGDDDMRDITDKRTQGTFDDGQEDVTSGC